MDNRHDQRERREPVSLRPIAASDVAPRRIAGSESIAALTKALRSARLKFGAVVKDQVNPHFRHPYADLPSVLEAVKDALEEHGLLVLHSTRWEGGELWLDTTLEHESGEWIGSVYPLFAASYLDPQKIGGALTYARRYVVLAMLGIAPEDDDGETAAGRGQAPQQRPQPRPDQRPQKRRLPRTDADGVDREAVNRDFPAKVARPETWSKWIGPILTHANQQWRQEMSREGIGTQDFDEHRELGNEPREVNYLITRLIELGRLSAADVAKDKDASVRDPAKCRRAVEDYFAKSPSSIRKAVYDHLKAKRQEARAKLGMPDTEADDERSTDEQRAEAMSN